MMLPGGRRVHAVAAGASASPEKTDNPARQSPPTRVRPVVGRVAKAFMSPSASLVASPFRCVLDVRASLGECPVWSVAEQVLYWVDINAPSLNRFDPATGRNTAMALPESIGCFALRHAGGFIVALRSGFWLARQDGTLDRKVAAAPYDPAHHRFNDGRCDPQGRLLAGSMNESRDAATGALYRLDPDFALTPLLSGMTISNGLAFSPDGRTMYHTDTSTQAVNGYEYDAASGTPSRPRVLVRFTAEGDRPDGAAVDRDGCYWTALYRGGKVKRIAPDGRVLAEYAVPAMCPTMCAFGGPDRKTLYVTSARQKREADELARLPLSGGLFAMAVDAPGLAEPLFAG
jgi:sugar lactone lactonase YvrE